MIQRAPAAEVLQEITAQINAQIQPWRIVLYGSRARGDATDGSDYDIFVEVDSPDDECRRIEDQLYQQLSGQGWSLDLKVRARGEIERRRDDPGTLEWDVAREGIVLFADPAAPTMLTSRDRVSEPRGGKPESVLEWLEVAERDLRLCRHLVEIGENYWAQVCFLSQQTSEKHMKALLISKRVRPERTHDLSELLRAVRAAGCLLPGIDADCKLLARYAAAPRYPSGLRLTENNARTALAAAERIVAALRAQLRID